MVARQVVEVVVLVDLHDDFGYDHEYERHGEDDHEAEARILAGDVRQVELAVAEYAASQRLAESRRVHQMQQLDRVTMRLAV